MSVSAMRDSFATLRKLDDEVWFHSLAALADALGQNLDRLPISLKVLIENLLRHEDDITVTREDIAALASWPAPAALDREVAFYPVRVLMPDSSGVPLLIDMAALRDAMVARGLDPRRINPVIPTDLVIDHSVRVDFAGAPDAFAQSRRRARAQSRALRRGALGDGAIREFPRGAARQRHRPSGQHRALRAGRRLRRARRPPARLSGQPRWHGQPYADGQRARRLWLGRRRHRGGDRDVRPADRAAGPARGRLPSRRG